MEQPPRGLDPRLFRASRSIDSTWWHWTVNVIAASPALSRRTRARVLAKAGIEVGNAIVESGCFFFGSNVRLGDWSVTNHRCYFDARDRIEIGTGTGLAPEVMLCTSTHHVGPSAKRYGAYRTAPISIGDGAWIGTRAVILPGVTVGPGAIVAAGAVVTGDVEADAVYAGIPARKVRDLDPA